MLIDNLLNTDIFEVDEKRLEVNEKITKMLNKYFKIDSSKKLDNEEENYYNGKHLYINYLEFKNYKEIADKADFDEKEFDFKHDGVYQQIAKANIYPGKYEYYDPISSMNEEDKKFCNKCSHIILILITLITLLLLIGKQFVLFLVFYLIGAIAQFLYAIKYKYLDIEELNGEIVKKLEKILNAKPCLELFYEGKCIIKIPFHSYADISGIKFIKNGDFENVVFEKIDLDTQNVVYQFPIKFIYFVDSTQQYFMFLITQFNKYGFLKNVGFKDILEKMYLKFSLLTRDNETIYKNDPFFYTLYGTINLKRLRIFAIISSLLHLAPFLVCKLNRKFLKKIIDIKKTISIKHDLEEYIDLDTLFLKVVKSDKKIKRENHKVISDKKTIQNQFIQECVNLTEQIKEIADDLSNNHRDKVFRSDCGIEASGYLTPFYQTSGFSQSKNVYETKEFLRFYGTKVEKILGKSENEIFSNFEMWGDEEDLLIPVGHSNYNMTHNTNNKGAGQKERSKNLTQVIYTENTLSLKCTINKNFVMVNYNIKLPNSSNKSGNFKLEKPLGGGGFEELKEMENPEWTKSEIYIPGCQDVIEIIRKKRSIKISAGDFEIISDTKINDDLLSGTGTWLNENDWDQRTINKYIKGCNRVARKNRFSTDYN